MVGDWQAGGGMKMWGLGFYLWRSDCLSGGERLDGHREMVDGFGLDGFADHLVCKEAFCLWMMIAAVGTCWSGATLCIPCILGFALRGCPRSINSSYFIFDKPEMVWQFPLVHELEVLLCLQPLYNIKYPLFCDRLLILGLLFCPGSKKLGTLVTKEERCNLAEGAY